MNLNQLSVALYTLVHKEIRRFMRIWPQTLLPPAITMSLYFVIFGTLVGSRIGEMGGFSYMQFIVPGLIMMAVITNSYANLSSSFFSAKFQKSLEELIMSPVPLHAILWGFVLGGVCRGVLVGIIVTAMSLFFTDQQLEEQLGALLSEVLRPDRTPARIARIDADTTKAKGALEGQLGQVHSGEVDVLVGTQMIPKGHDFRRITLVAAVQPDGALVSSDFRAAERLFALLMQAAGRAGRDAAYMAAQAVHGTQPEMWVQSFHTKHAVFEALRTHDYEAFAAQQLKEREEAAMPPFSFQALVRTDARTQEVAQGFLSAATAAAHAAQLPGLPDGTYQVPMEVRPERRVALGIRWLIKYAYDRREKTMRDKLAGVLIAASNGEGSAVKKREDVHRMADANRAFAHFRW